jgi:hypothetical protein
MLTAKQSIASATDSSNMSQKLIMGVHLLLQHAKVQINLVFFKFIANFVVNSEGSFAR